MNFIKDQIFAANVTYLNPKLYQEVKTEVSKKIPASYVRNLQVLKLYKQRGGKVRYAGKSPSSMTVKKNLKKEHINKIKGNVIDLHMSVGSENLSSLHFVIAAELHNLIENPTIGPNTMRNLQNYAKGFVECYHDDKVLKSYIEAGQESFIADLEKFERAVSKLSEAVLDVKYRPMQKNEKGPEQIKSDNALTDEAVADNEDGMLNNPTPLSKKGGSATYGGTSKDNPWNQIKNAGRVGGQSTESEMMPDIQDDQFSVLSTADDDSYQDFVEWVQPLQQQIEDLKSCLDNIHQQLSSNSANTNSVSNDLSNFKSQHEKGHLPPISGPGQMNDVLKTLGMDKDYLASPKSIYASDGTIKELVIHCKRK